MSRRLSPNPEFWRDRTLLDRDGEKIGTIAEVYVDTGTGRPVWVLVHVGLFGTRETIVPVTGARRHDGDLHVPFAKAFVKDAPHVDADHELSSEQEAALSDYYGLRWGSATGPMTACGPAPSVRNDPVVVDLSARVWRRNRPGTDPE